MIIQVGEGVTGFLGLDVQGVTGAEYRHALYYSLKFRVSTRLPLVFSHTSHLRACGPACEGHSQARGFRVECF
jgi:hypothetical protein